MTEKYTVQIITPKGKNLGSFHFNGGMTHRVLQDIVNNHVNIRDRIKHLRFPPSAEDIEWSNQAGKVAEKAQGILNLMQKEWE